MVGLKGTGCVFFEGTPFAWIERETTRKTVAPFWGPGPIP